MRTEQGRGLQRLARHSQAGIVRALLCAAFLVGTSAGALADTIEGLVIAVLDGDTVTVLDESKVQHRVRLAGIDAPEKGQPFGQRSKEGLSSLTYMRQASVDWHKLDRYGRVIGKVHVDGRDVNLAQVASGLAWHYAAYAKEQAPADRTSYSLAEARARDSHLGLWKDAAPTPALGVPPGQAGGQRR